MTRLLVFDSGIGGLSVAGEIRRELPDAELIYVADDLGFPYGEWEAPALADRVVGIVAGLIYRFSPAVVVIACNTASTLVLPLLRSRFTVPFVGTVPAIKPAAAQTATGLVSVLATEGTMRRDYTRDLIRNFAGDCDVRLVGSSRLASLAEAFMRGDGVDDAAVLDEIVSAFVEKDGRRTDTIVLACTHYPFLLDLFRRLAPWPVTWIDPAPAIARRVLAVVGTVDQEAPTWSGRAIVTSGKPWSPGLAPILKELGLDAGSPS